MTQEALIRQLQISCLGLDPIDPLRLLVDDVIEALAQTQEPVAYLCENGVGHKYFRWKKPSSTYKPIALYTSPPQRTEQNFCSRCGKRTKDIHTCTPPQE